MMQNLLLLAACLSSAAAPPADVLPPHVPVAVRHSQQEVLADFPLPQVLMAEADKLPSEPSKTPLFIRFKWDGKLPDTAAVLAHPPGVVVACELMLPPNLTGPAAEQALKDFSAAVKQKLPTPRTVAILTKPFQVERSPAVDFIMPAETSLSPKEHPGWQVFRYLSFATWRKSIVIPGGLTAAEIIRGAAWGTIPSDENSIRRLVTIHGLISILGGYASAEDDASGMVLFLLPGGLSTGPEWWLSQLDGWFEAALDAGLHLQILQASEYPRVTSNVTKSFLFPYLKV